MAQGLTLTFANQLRRWWVMTEIAGIHKIMNGYILSNTPANNNTVYFKDPQDAGEALATLLAKEKLTRNEPVQLDMFDNAKKIP